MFKVVIQYSIISDICHLSTVNFIPAIGHLCQLSPVNFISAIGYLCHLSSVNCQLYFAIRHRFKNRAQDMPCPVLFSTDCK